MIKSEKCLSDLCDDACLDLTKNKIDGVYIGDDTFLIDLLIRYIKNNWLIVLLANPESASRSFKRSGRYLYIEVTDSFEQLKNDLKNLRGIELLYVFNENNEGKFIIDDFPCEVTVALDFFTECTSTFIPAKIDK